MKPDIQNEDGSMYDIKTVSTWKSEEVEFDSDKMAKSVEWACSTPRGGGKSFANLYQQSLNQMIQAMAVPSSMLGAPCSSFSATQIQGRQFRDTQRESEKYSTSKEYPYEVERIEEAEDPNSPLVWLYHYSKNANRHCTRMEAEKDSLTMFVAFHKKQYYQYTNVQSKHHRREPKFNGYSKLNINAKKLKLS